MRKSIIILLLAYGSMLQAQSPFTLVEGTHQPRNPTENTWWYNPKAEWGIHVFHGGAWQELDVDVRQTPQLWHGMVLMADGHDKSVATVDGRLLLDGAERLFWKGEVWGALEAGIHRIVLNRRGDTLVMDTAPMGAPPAWKSDSAAFPWVVLPIEWDTVAGVLSASLPQYKPGTADLWWEEMRNWGILGQNGQWIVEPKFDEAFRFHNGFADVLYYGEKRKINEKGEFVE